MAAKAKEKGLSVKDAAEAFVLLHDSGNYSGREYDMLLDALRDAVKKSDDGPILPADYEKDVDSPRGAESAADLAAEVVQRDEEGTLTPSDDGGRELARMTKVKAQKVAKDN